MPKRKRKNKDRSKKDVKFKGVQRSGKTFQAKIRIDGSEQYLGLFDTAKKAARAYDRAAMQAGKPPTKLNFQDKVPMDYKPKKKKLKSSNTIGYRGVYKNGNRFVAQINIDGKQHHIGLFGTKKEAAIAHDLAAIQAKRLKSDLNFPDMHMIRVEKTSTKKTKKTKKTIKNKAPLLIKNKNKKKKGKSSTTESSNNNSSKTGGGHASREFPKIRHGSL